MIFATQMSIRVLIIEDEPLIASDIEMTLNNDNYHVVGIAHDAFRALDLLHRSQPDIVLLDIAIRGDKDGIEIANIIQRTYKIPFIYVTSFSDRETLERAKSTLPDGYIVKPFKDRDIISAIEMAVYRFSIQHNREFPSLQAIQPTYSLTAGEYEVMKLVWEGHTNQQVTEKLSVSINTVKTHLKNIFLKLDVSTRSEAIAAIRKL